MKKVIAIIGRGVGFLLMSLLIGYNVFLLNAKFVLHQQLPMLGGYGYAIVLSGSMSPTFEVDDMVVIRQEESYNPDDIVTFVDSSNDLVTHRLISIDTEKGTAVTKGDANNVCDPELKTERIKGRVVSIIPKVGVFVSIITNPFFAVSVIVIAFFLMERSYGKEKTKKQSDIDKIKAEIEMLKASAEDGESSVPKLQDGSDAETENDTASSPDPDPEGSTQ